MPERQLPTSGRSCRTPALYNQNGPLSCERTYYNMLQILQEEIVNCTRCPRLREHCVNIATVKRRAYRDWEYWGRPVPAFGDPHARVLILGLAPGAHGSNRTGRMFTGDGSGNVLYRVLYKTGFAAQPHSIPRDDGMELHDIRITAAAQRAPPGNT